MLFAGMAESICLGTILAAIFLAMIILGSAAVIGYVRWVTSAGFIILWYISILFKMFSFRHLTSFGWNQRKFSHTRRFSRKCCKACFRNLKQHGKLCVRCWKLNSSLWNKALLMRLTDKKLVVNCCPFSTDSVAETAYCIYVQCHLFN